MKRSAALSLAALYFLAASLPSTVSAVFVKIPAGTFQMGHDGAVRLPQAVTGGQGNRLYGDANEKPAVERKVEEPFEMQRYEVTNQEYERFDPSHRALRGKLNFSYADDEAVVWVSWYNASNYAAWMTAQDEKYEYRLPTEVEWEYSCRAGTKSPYNTGEQFPKEQRKNNVVVGYKGNPEA